MKACWLALFRVSLSSTTAQWRWSSSRLFELAGGTRGGWPTLWSRTRPPSHRFLSGCTPRASRAFRLQPRNSLENLSGMLPICRKNKSNPEGAQKKLRSPVYIPRQTNSDRRIIFSRSSVFTLSFPLYFLPLLHGLCQFSDYDIYLYKVSCKWGTTGKSMIPRHRYGCVKINVEDLFLIEEKSEWKTNF